jgi:ABC-type dipeptide/oligopeptide/nickel transport system permease component
MLGYVLRRLAISIVVLFLATIVVFLLVAESGDPLALLRSNPKIPHATIVARQHLLHLDDSLPQETSATRSPATRSDPNCSVTCWSPCGW